MCLKSSTPGLSGSGMVYFLRALLRGILRCFARSATSSGRSLIGSPVVQHVPHLWHLEENMAGHAVVIDSGVLGRIQIREDLLVRLCCGLEENKATSLGSFSDFAILWLSSIDHLNCLPNFFLDSF